ncbi:Protease Do-like 10 [Hibiscus syriacus]|uniref:Protease Do-like 10 n=1 Tax=Hibiscus syriacus TaxID=106335 RepID=A0A6A3B4I9_HIBSY|nr:Protease Do-like 10 [Hibiscus syriacus]
MLSCSVRTLRRLKFCCNNLPFLSPSSSFLLAKGYCFSKPRVVPSFCNIGIKFRSFYVWERQSSLRQWRKRSLYTETDAFSAIELALDSVVKIFTVSSSPNYLLPWQNKSQRETMGSGFVIPGKKILTNAHVQAVGHECDLAILVVESPEFWEGMNFLELGDIPFLQEAVVVVGYPQGGDNISITKGVVSRVEPTQYVHGATQLMAIQIDAAINPGNSGGPAIMGNKVAGVAFQNLSGAENIGYIIPVPVIKHFIAGLEESGKYVGFCSMGLSCQPTENVQLRNHFKMQPHMTGVLVSKINPLSNACGVLKKDDIILEFDGVPIANDGTVLIFVLVTWLHLSSVSLNKRPTIVTIRCKFWFLESEMLEDRISLYVSLLDNILACWERITFDHLVSMKKPNETALVKVLRNGEEHAFTVTLRPLQPLVPVHQFDKLPSYYIFAGLVFVPLTQPYLHEYGEDWYNTSPRRLCERAIRELPKKAGEQLVISSQVLMDDINAGYERLAELQLEEHHMNVAMHQMLPVSCRGLTSIHRIWCMHGYLFTEGKVNCGGQVKKVNGTEIENLKHLCLLVENCSTQSLRIDLDDDRVVALNYESARIATSRILERHRIPYQMSADLVSEQNNSLIESAS